MKMLYITSLSGKRINSYMKSAVVAAQELGIDFTLACNTKNADRELYKQDCETYNFKLVHIDFDKNPLGKSNIKAKKQLIDLMKKEQFDCVQCNTPIGGVLGRICAHKVKIPYVIYMAHGFHFWKGAPKKNWLIYYTVEKFLAQYTDLLIAINNEDLKSAQRFKLKKDGRVIYIPGVGVDIEKIRNLTINIAEKRKEIGIPLDAKVYVTVGEVRKQKNQETIIKAFEKANLSNSYLLICGNGEDKEHLIGLVNVMGKTESIKFLGFRTDIDEILKASDCFVFATYKEGLSAALMEAMAAGLPCIASSIRGNVDLLPDSKLLFEPDDANRLARLLEQSQDEKLMDVEVEKNWEYIKKFDFYSVVNEFKAVYRTVQEKI